MAEVSYGHIAIVPKGVWSSETQYEVGHLVEHDGSSYVVKTRPPVGTLPTDESYWQLSAKGNTVATGNIAGVVKGSDDITVGENGELFVNTTFEQATELANLIAGEAIKEVLGKVSKAIATTMDLDQNALLKNMISGIDTNDGNKVPSSAFVHTLHERLGMGTALAAGDASNVTQAINKLYSNLATSLILSKAIKTLPDGTYCGASEVITIPGFYNIYKSPDSPNPDLRWIIREESAVYDSQWIHIQTAYSLQGSAFQIKQRMWTFAETGVGHWSEWL